MPVFVLCIANVMHYVCNICHEPLFTKFSGFMSSQVRIERPTRAGNCSCSDGLLPARENVQWILCGSGREILLTRPAVPGRVEQQ